MNDQNIQAIYPLTRIQEGILFHCIDSTGGNVYATQYSCQVDGDVCLERFKEAWDTVVKRHSVLRTFFTWEKRDRPLQIVRHRVDLPLTVVDWRNRSASEQQNSLRQFLRTDRQLEIKLDEAPLMRVQLIRLKDNAVHVVWTFHHIMLDGWSRHLVFEEFLTLYFLQSVEGEFALEPAPDFGAFVTWQQNDDQETASQFWRDRLEGFSTPTTPKVTTHDDEDPELAGPGRYTRLELDRSLSNNIRQLAQQLQFTVNTVVVAAWSVLLARYCDSEDVVFGTTVSGRSAKVDGIEKMCGIFINTLPLRVHLNDETDVEALLKQIQLQQVAHQEFEHTSLQRIRRSSDVPSSTPLFETILVFENVPNRSQTMETEVSISKERVDEFSSFPLALLVLPADSIEFICVHDTRRFSASVIAQMLRDLQHILSELTSSPKQTIGTICAMPEAQRVQLLRSWNSTDHEFDTVAETVADVIEARARDTPLAVAVTAGGAVLNYEQLNERANQYARCMQRRGSTPGVPVIIYMERSAEAIISMIAAMKIGAPYVPIDANDSSNRLNSVVGDLQACFSGKHADYKPLLVTQGALRDRSVQSGADVLLTDEITQGIDKNNVSCSIAAEDVAYIIYTSGSTGKPKGVMVQHHALLNSTLARGEFYAEPPTVYALLSSLATDSSIAGIYWTLCFGGNLLLPGQKTELDMPSLMRLFADHQVTHTLCVPSLYSMFLEHDDLDALSSLRVAILAGDSCRSSLATTHHRKLRHTLLYNEYGPSEACVWATAAKIDSSDISIGRPIANTQVYVLDSSRRPVPIGVAGELYIAGANVAMGYLGDDESTKRNFVPNPFGNKSGTMYKTGDSVRYREDGVLDFLGRIDNQIKIRGYRVEPAEIEATLTSHASVDAAVAFVELTTEADDLDTLISSVDNDVVEELLARIEVMDTNEVDLRLVELGKNPVGSQQ